MADSQDRHRYPGHQVRIPPWHWNPAKDRARNEHGLGMRELIHGWVVAFADGRLDPIPVPEDLDEDRPK